MSKSEDNTNELESYGVWVKNPAGNDTVQTDNVADDTFEQTNEDTLDLPDFDDTDFSDMFKDDSQFSSTNQDDSFGEDLDSTLSTDELAKITDLGEESVEDIDVSSPSEDNSFITNEAEPIFDEETAVDITDKEPEVIEEEPLTINNDSDGEEEISLDDFLDEGFSDESVASGNNGYEPGAEPDTTEQIQETEELSLDDFLDGETFEQPVEEKQAVNEDEAPIDMDISFDDSIETVETEENLSLDNDDDFEEAEEIDDSDTNLETEEVSFDEFGITEDSLAEQEIEESVAEASANDTVDFDTEEIDLSDFGIDEEAEETPIIQDVESQKNKDKVVDYDLFVGNESTSSAPVVNEIKQEEPETAEQSEEVIVEQASNTTNVDNSLLQQIVADLSSLKDEINNLKTNIAEIKSNEENRAIVQEKTLNEDIIDIPEDEDQGGFFNADDTDETIALSGDELSNIMNNADFGDSDIDPLEEDTDEVEAQAYDDIIEEPEAPTFDETAVEEILPEADDNSDNMEIAENEDISFSYEDEKPEEPTFDHIDDDLNIDNLEDQDENVPEEIDIPKSEDILVESNDADFMDSVKDSTEDELDSADPLPEAEEISPLEAEESFDDIIDGLEINEEDDSSEANDSEMKIPSVEDIEKELSNSDNAEEPQEAEEVPTVDMLLNTPIEDEPEVDVIDEEVPVIPEETQINENETADFSPMITDEETEALTATDEELLNAENDFNSVDNLDNDLSSSNIDYLTSEESNEVNEPSNNNDLKQEIKSVLLYMDQLLENLPEDKIYEFAKSDEFTTYKKLFKDLGLA